MSLFFFHLVSRDEFIRDDQGKQFGDMFEAYCYARSLIQKAGLYDVGDWRGWSVKITDADDRSTLSVLFPQEAHCYSEGRSTMLGATARPSGSRPSGQQ